MNLTLTLTMNLTLTLTQAWDHNLYKWNTALATVTLDLGRLAMNAQERESRDDPTTFHPEIHGPIPPIQNAVLEAIDGFQGRLSDCMADLCMKEGSRSRDADASAEEKVWLPLRYIEQHSQDDGAIQAIEIDILTP